MKVNLIYVHFVLQINAIKSIFLEMHWSYLLLADIDFCFKSHLPIPIMSDSDFFSNTTKNTIKDQILLVWRSTENTGTTVLSQNIWIKPYGLYLYLFVLNLESGFNSLLWVLFMHWNVLLIEQIFKQISSPKKRISEQALKPYKNKGEIIYLSLNIYQKIIQ